MFRFTDIGSRSKRALLGLLAAVVLFGVLYRSAVELDHRSRARVEGQTRQRVDVPGMQVGGVGGRGTAAGDGRGAGQTETDGRLATLWAAVFGLEQSGTDGGRQAPERGALLTTVGVNVVVLLSAVLLGVGAVRRRIHPSSAPSARRAPAPAPVPSLVLSPALSAALSPRPTAPAAAVWLEKALAGTTDANTLQRLRTGQEAPAAGRLDGGATGSPSASEQDRDSVLVVDDHAAIRELVREVLQSAGYAVREAPDGEVALRLAREAPPDLILLDVGMPVMDGRQFAAAYRQEPGRRAPVVVMTAAQDTGRWAAELDADGHLGKPFGVADLLATVARFAVATPAPARGGRPEQAA